MAILPEKKLKLYEGNYKVKDFNVGLSIRLEQGFLQLIDKNNSYTIFPRSEAEFFISPNNDFTIRPDLFKLEFEVNEDGEVTSLSRSEGGSILLFEKIK